MGCNISKNNYLEDENKIKIGTFILPAGIESSYGIISIILQFLDIRSLSNLKESSFIKQLTKKSESEDFECVREYALSPNYKGIRNINEMIQKKGKDRLVVLIKRYQKEFKKLKYEDIPFMYACSCGRIDDVQLFVNLHPFYMYLGNSMTLKEMVNYMSSLGYTPLMEVMNKQHIHIVKYLIEQCEADPNIADSFGMNALHLAFLRNIRDIDVIQLLLNHMTIDSINQKSRWGSTPLDVCYTMGYDVGFIQIVQYLRSKGGRKSKILRKW